MKWLGMLPLYGVEKLHDAVISVPVGTGWDKAGWPGVVPDDPEVLLAQLLNNEQAPRPARPSRTVRRLIFRDFKLASIC